MKRSLPALALLLGLVVLLSWLWPSPKTAPHPREATKQARPKTSPPLRRSVIEAEAVPQDQDAVGGLLLEGQVLGADAKPAPGATVWLDTQPPRSAETNEFGWFSFEGLTGRPYQIAARRGSASVGPLLFNLTQDAGPIILTLSQGSTLKVTVVDALSKQPIPQAEVSLSALSTQSKRTEGDGVALFEGVGSGRFILRAAADGYGPSRIEVFPIGTEDLTQQYQLALERGAALSGTVIDGSGRPIEGALIEVLPAATVLFYSFGNEAARSDARGEFSFAALAPGSYRLRATHPEFAPSASAPLSLDGVTAKHGVTLTMERGGTISGVVVDQDGAPSPFALVRFVFNREPSLKPSRQLYCDERGAFEARGLPRTELALSASQEQAQSEHHLVDLTEQAAREVELVVEPRGAISGVVVDASGTPQPNIVVRVLARRGVLELPKNTPSTLTDPDGRFLLQGLPEGQHTVQAVTPGAPRQSFAEFGAYEEHPWQKIVSVGDKEVRLVLNQNSSLHGKIISEDQQRPERFSVLLDDNPFQPDTFQNEEGAFHLTEIPPGEHELTITGSSFADTEVDDLLLEPGEDKDLGTIVVKRGLRVQGKVVTPEGAGAANARVVIARRIGGGLAQLFGFAGDFEDGKEMSTSDDGSFVFDGLEAESYLLMAEHPRYGRSTYLRVEAKQGPKVTLRLGAFGAISGTITRGGEPVQAMLTLNSLEVSDNDVELMVTSEADGSYRFDKLSAGTYRLRYGDSYRASLLLIVLSGQEQSQELSLQPGEERTLDLDFPGGPVLLAQAKKKDGSPIKARLFLFVDRTPPATLAGLIALTEQDHGVRVESTDPFLQPPNELPPHTAVFSGVAAGSYQLCVLPEEGEPPPESPAVCRQVTVAASPGVQSLSVGL